MDRPLRSPFEGLDDPATFATTFPEPRAVTDEPLSAEGFPVDDFDRSAQPAKKRLLGGAGPFDPGRRGVKALAVVAAVVVLLAAFFAYRSRPRAEQVGDVPTAPAASWADAGSSPSTKDDGEIIVAVAGKVRKPGLVRLRPGARVADAVEAAGGTLPGTDLAAVNLARRVADGELVLVGVTPPPGSTVEGSGTGPAGAGGGKVNLNTATVQELDSLPGVGPVLAQRIVDHRAAKGGFKSVNDLRSVDGIGASRFEDLKDLVTV